MTSGFDRASTYDVSAGGWFGVCGGRPYIFVSGQNSFTSQGNLSLLKQMAVLE